MAGIVIRTRTAVCKNCGDKIIWAPDDASGDPTHGFWFHSGNGGSLCTVDQPRAEPDPLTEEEHVDETPLAEEKDDPIHPKHYGVGQVHEVYKCLRAWGLESDALLWTLCTYVERAGKKSPDVLEDLKKARWFLDRRIEQLEEKKRENS